MFVGGFDAEAAMAVAPGLTVDVFARLVDKSVVASGQDLAWATRVTGCSRPSASTPRVAGGERRARGPASVTCATSRAVAERGPGWPPFIPGALLDELRQDYENIRAALEWAADADPCAGLRLLAATRELFQKLGPADGRRIAQLLLERCPARDRCRVEVLITAGILAMVMANAEASLAFHSEARG